MKDLLKPKIGAKNYYTFAEESFTVIEPSESNTIGGNTIEGNTIFDNTYYYY